MTSTQSKPNEAESSALDSSVNRRRNTYTTLPGLAPPKPLSPSSVATQGPTRLPASASNAARRNTVPEADWHTPPPTAANSMERPPVSTHAASEPRYTAAQRISLSPSPAAAAPGVLPPVGVGSGVSQPRAGTASTARANASITRSARLPLSNGSVSPSAGSPAPTPPARNSPASWVGTGASAPPAAPSAVSPASTSPGSSVSKLVSYGGRIDLTAQHAPHSGDAINGKANGSATAAPSSSITAAAAPSSTKVCAAIKSFNQRILEEEELVKARTSRPRSRAAGDSRNASFSALPLPSTQPPSAAPPSPLKVTAPAPSPPPATTAQKNPPAAAAARPAPPTVAPQPVRGPATPPTAAAAKVATTTGPASKPPAAAQQPAAPPTAGRPAPPPPPPPAAAAAAVAATTPAATATTTRIPLRQPQSPPQPQPQKTAPPAKSNGTLANGVASVRSSSGSGGAPTPPASLPRSQPRSSAAASAEGPAGPQRATLVEQGPRSGLPRSLPTATQPGLASTPPRANSSSGTAAAGIRASGGSGGGGASPHVPLVLTKPPQSEQQQQQQQRSPAAVSVGSSGSTNSARKASPRPSSLNSSVKKSASPAVAGLPSRYSDYGDDVAQTPPRAAAPQAAAGPVFSAVEEQTPTPTPSTSASARRGLSGAVAAALSDSGASANKKGGANGSASHDEAPLIGSMQKHSPGATAASSTPSVSPGGGSGSVNNSASSNSRKVSPVPQGLPKVLVTGLVKSHTLDDLDDLGDEPSTPHASASKSGQGGAAQRAAFAVPAPVPAPAAATAAAAPTMVKLGPDASLDSAVVRHRATTLPYAPPPPPPPSGGSGPEAIQGASSRNTIGSCSSSSITDNTRLPSAAEGDGRRGAANTASPLTALAVFNATDVAPPPPPPTQQPQQQHRPPPQPQRTTTATPTTTPAPPKSSATSPHPPAALQTKKPATAQPVTAAAGGAPRPPPPAAVSKTGSTAPPSTGTPTTATGTASLRPPLTGGSPAKPQASSRSPPPPPLLNGSAAAAPPLIPPATTSPPVSVSGVGGLAMSGGQQRPSSALTRNGRFASSRSREGQGVLGGGRDVTDSAASQPRVSDADASAETATLNTYLKEEELNLSMSTFNSVGTTLAQSMNLRVLNLKGSTISGEGLRGLANIQTLKSICVSHMRNLTTLLPLVTPTVAGVRCAIEEIDAQFSNIRNEGIFELEKLRRLRRLDLSMTPISSVTCLASSVSLNDLYLTGTRVDNFGVVGLERVPTLTTLNIARTKVTSVVQLAKSRSLQTLVLYSCQVNDSGFAGVAEMPRLATLDVSTTKIEDLSVLSKSRSLKSLKAQWLSLKNCQDIIQERRSQMDAAAGTDGLDWQDTEAGFAGLASIATLETLDLSFNTLRSVHSLCRSKSLKHLFLKRTRIENSGIGSIAQLAPTLETLVITNLTDSLDDEDDEHEFESNASGLLSLIGDIHILHRLTLLDLSYTDVFDLRLLQNIRTLRELIIVETLVTVDGLRGIETIPSLELLDVSQTSILSLQFLVGGAPVLKRILARSNRNTSGFALGDIHQLPALEHLDLSDTIVEDMENVPKKLWRLKELVWRWGERRDNKGLAPSLECWVTSPRLADLHDMPCLSFLDLTSSRVHNLAFLAKAPCLRTLHLKLCKLLRNHTITDLGTLAELEVLQLTDNTHITDVTCLRGCRKLRELHLTNTRVNTKGLDGVTTLPELKVLNITNTRAEDEQINGVQAAERSRMLEDSMMRDGSGILDTTATPAQFRVPRRRRVSFVANDNTDNSSKVS